MSGRNISTRQAEESKQGVLLDLIDSHFNREELKELCFVLGADYDNLQAEGKRAKARELILFLHRRGRLPHLIEKLHQLRPHLEWPTVSVVERQLEHEAARGRPLADRPRVWLIIALVVVLTIIVIFYGAGNLREAPSDEAEPTPRLAASVPSQKEDVEDPASLSRIIPFKLIVGEELGGPKYATLRDMAAANGHLWFATAEGLFHIQEGSDSAGRVRLEDGFATGIGVVETVAVETVAVNKAGADVWLGLGGDEHAGQVGRYLSDDDLFDWFTPVVDEQELNLPVVAIEVGVDDTVWFANFFGQIFRFDVLQNQGRLLPTPTPPILSVVDIALDPFDGQTVWVVGGSYVYRWQTNTWVTTLMHSDIASGLITSVAMDGQGRVWFGHDKGVTLFKPEGDTGVFQTCSIPALSPGVVSDLAISNDGQELWIITSTGLAWLDVSSMLMLSENCERWDWRVWTSNDGFWQGDPDAVYRLTVDEALVGDTTRIWIMKRNADEVRILIDANKEPR